MPTKKPLSPTVEVMSDGENIFVVADGIMIATRGGPGTPQAKTGFHTSLAGKCSTTIGCSLST